MVAITSQVVRRDEQAPPPASPPKPPSAEKKPHTTSIHGTTLVDDYFWLREKGSAQVMEYLRAEERYTDAVMQPTQRLQDALYQEMLGHIKQTDVSVPYRVGEYFYYTRTTEGLQYPVVCRKRGSTRAREQILLDMNALAEGHDFFSIGVWRVSDDGRTLAYTSDVVGYRQFVLRLKDLKTGRLLAERVERVGNVVWATDNRTLFYVTEDEVTKRQNKLFRHVIGSDRHDLVYEEKDELFDLDVVRTRDKAFILAQSASKTSTEIRYLPADRPTAGFAVVMLREPDHEYDVDHRGDLFYIRTNKGAKNFRVVTAPVSDSSERNWKELVAHRPQVKVEAIDLFAGHAALSEWQDGLHQIEVIDLRNGVSRRVAYPEPVYSVSLVQNAEFATTTLRYAYQSLVTPASVFAYGMKTGRSKLLKETKVPGGFNRRNYRSERLYATATDGTKIPLSVVYRKGVKRDGRAPLLLYAYGSYGYSTPPAFSPARLPLLDRGVVYAIAHVRGGGELGEEWRDAGRMMRKMTTFTDFIASAEYLIAARYTSREKLVIQGGSAGGMLVAAVANMRPDLFKAVIAQVPFVDVINTMLDASLPLTTGEYIEWGNPNEKPAFDCMRAYSPYDNVKRQAYPAMLVKVSVNDSQVAYWEGAKFVAKLRSLKTDDHPLLLKVNFGAGHGGSSGRYDALRETAFNWAFALGEWGLRRAKGKGQKAKVRSA
jgi:oligopeptidase B